MRLLGLVNPNAGGGAALRRVAQLRACGPMAHEVEWVVTRSASEAEELIARAPTGGVDGVVLVGGDGTVHRALSALAGAALPFGIIPAGRGNDFARNVGLGRGAGAALLRSRDIGVRRVDLPVVNGRAFGSVACLGFDAEVSRLARERAGLLGGTAGYLVCVGRALIRLRPFPVELAVDGWRWSGDITLLAVANGPCYGGGMRIAPQAVMDDGVLDVCLVCRVGRPTLLWQLPRVFRGEHAGHPRVILRRGPTVTIETESAREIYADGEPAGSTPAVCSIGATQLRVLVPGKENPCPPPG